jgi:hypothetical protein
MRRSSQVVWLDVPVRLRPPAALAGVLAGALAYAAARRRSPEQPALALSLLGVLAWYELELIHVTGHIISARMANAPMDYISWSILAMTGYNKHDVTPEQHIGRAVGGPIASAAAALTYWLVWRLLGDTLLGRAAQHAFLLNGLTVLVSLLPSPIFDGGVILENVGKLRIEN